MATKKKTTKKATPKAVTPKVAAPKNSSPVLHDGGAMKGPAAGKERG